MFIVFEGWTFAAMALRLGGCCEECALSTGITIGQCPGAARGVRPTVGLGMLEAASPWGCRGELVPRGSSETDSVPLAP